MAEQIFFENGGIRITSARAIFDDQTFALGGITSVRGVKTRGWLVKLMYLLALGALIGMFQEGGAAYFYMPVLIVIFIYLSEFFSKYVILFSSASGEAKAYTSRNKNLIADIVKAINDAMVHRG